MSTVANASTAQVPEVGSDEWVAQTLKAKGIQAAEADEFLDGAESQDDESQATTTEAAQFVDPTQTAAPSWRDVVIPLDDDTVPQHFRGKSVAEYEKSRRELERQWNEDRTRMRKLEAEAAARDTFKEFLTEQRQAATPPTPADPYRAAGIDLETDPVLNPTKFFPQQEKMILERARQLMAQELQKRDEEAAAAEHVKEEERRISVALAHVEKERGLSEQQMRARIPSMLMAAGEQFGRDALKDPAVILQVHDQIFGAPAPVAIPATQQAPNPPGVKRPAAVESTTKTGTNLKNYETEILEQVGAEISNMIGGMKIDQDRLKARYAVNLKRMRG